MKFILKHKCYFVFLIVLSFNLFSESQNLIGLLGIEKNKLSTDAIYFENYLGRKSNLEFSYGESIIFRFDGLTGFLLENELAFPNASIEITNIEGEIVYEQKGLLDEITEGFSEDELNLRGSITFAKPMMPNIQYTLRVKVVDKKSDAFYNFEKEFTIKNSSIIDVETNGLKYDVLYLYAKERDLSLIDNRISPNEKVYILLEGLDGYNTLSNEADILVNLELTDANGYIIEKTDNLLPNPVKSEALKQQLFAEVVVSDGEITNPITCTLFIQDRLSKKTLKSSVSFIVN